MKILMLNLFYHPYPGGTEKHLHEACTRLAKKFDVTVLCSQAEGQPREEIVEGVRIVRTPSVVLYSLPHPLPPPVPLMISRGADLWAEAKKADVVHMHNRFVYHLGDVFTIKKLLGKKMAVTLHNARPQGIDFATDLLGSFYDDTIGYTIMKNCNRIAGVSQNTLDITVPDEFKEKTQVVYNGVDVKMFKPSNKPEGIEKRFGFEGKKVILTVCRLVEQKGLVYLLEAMSHVLTEEKEAHLVIVGRGPLLDELKRKSLTLGLEESITFIPERISEKDLARIYAACDVFVLPSLWEPFGMVVVEAMASGKPVVGSKIGGIPEIILDEKTGFLVPPRGHEELAEKILFLLKNPKKARSMGVWGRKRAEKSFTWDETAKSYEKFYANI